MCIRDRRRGYRLAGGDPFCAEAVGPYPAPVQIYDTLQSSNLTAKQLALGGAPHGTLAVSYTHLKAALHISLIHLARARDKGEQQGQDCLLYTSP